MKNNYKSPVLSGLQSSLRRTIIASALLACAFIYSHSIQGQTIIQWNTGNGQWTNTTEWTGGVIPTIGDIASFNDSSLALNDIVTINVNPSNTLQVGSIYVGTSVAGSFSIRSQTTAATNTTLSLNAVNGVLISNVSTTVQLTFTNAANTTFLNLGLGTSGAIYANNGSGVTPPKDGNGGEIVIYSVITGSGSITNSGPGILDLLGVNTYTGNTVLTAGSLEVGTSGTLGTGTLYFEGGNLESGGSRTAAITNPIVVNAPGNAYIFSEVASANSTRIFPLSGSLTGTSGTLVLANPNTAANEIFEVELLGNFTFNLPLVAGDNLNDAYNDDTVNNTYTALVLANPSGVQTFNGNISGDGPVTRSNLTAALGGTTVFTGSNTYTGATLIYNGTLLANNTSGSALGVTSATVTNEGVLGGNGSIGCPTGIWLNGTVEPGVATNTVGNLTFTGGLSFNPGAVYNWQLSSATGTPGAAWSLITANGGWTDAVGGASPAVIYVNSQGLAPAGWNDANSYSWVLIANNGSPTGFNPNDWAVNLTQFGGTVAGVFAVTNDANGDLVLTYTPSSGNYLINVPSGSLTQGNVSPTNYPILTGLYTVTKIGNGEVIMTNSLNSYQGQTFIDAGTASAAVNSTTSGGAFGASTAPISLGFTNGASNATLNIDQTGVTIANAVTVQSGSSGTKTIGTTTTSGQVTNSGNVVLNDNVTLSVPSGGSDFFLGNFSGAGGVTFSGGTITMSGIASYSGASTLTGGTLNLNSSALGSNTFTISGASTLDNTSGGSVTIGNNPVQYWNADFNFGGTGDLNLGTGAVILGGNRNLTLSNNILTVGGTIAGTGFGITVSGDGELLLAGATNSTYTGGTTINGGILAVNATATLGSGAGTLTLAGGNLLDTSSRATSPISNPVVISANTRFYGNSTDVAAPDRYLPFTGGFSVTGGSTVYIDNVGSATTVFYVTLQGSNFTTINWPIVIGDPTFDTAGALSGLNLLNDNTTPTQTISSLITGTGSIVRGALAVNGGGTTILTAQNTFSGGVQLAAGAIGLGASSVLSGGAVVSGPLGTGQFELGAETAETNLTVFATGGSTEIDNPLFFNGDTNISFAGTNNLLFTGGVNSGGVAKSLSVASGITVTFSGPITNTGSSTGGALTIEGGGTLIFSGSNTYAGTTTVDVGKLLVNGSISTNTATVNPGGTLGGTGSIGGSVAFFSGGQAYLYKSAGSPDSPLTVAGGLTLSNNTVIVDLGGTTTLGPGTNVLLNYSGTLSGAFNPTPTFVNGSLAAGNAGTISMSTPNQVTLVVSAASYTAPDFSEGGVTVNANHTISLAATGALGTPYRLWATTNVALHPVTNTWTLISSNVISTSPFTNLDSAATNFPQRFYLFTSP